MKRVMFVATDFPPLAGTNVQRTQGFVASLPGLGWTPEVVTKAIADMLVIDTAQLSCLPPELATHRVLDPHPEAWLRRRKRVCPRDLAKVEDSVERVSAKRLDALALTALYVAIRPFVHRWLATPDENRLWAGTAAKYIAHLLQERRFDVLVSSSPSYSCHLAGLSVKRRTGIPWVVDLTDLWVGRPGTMSQRTGWQARTDARMESEVVLAADRIIVASPPWKSRLGNRYGPAILDKIRCVTLGFDSGKLGFATSSERTGPITLVCTGAMYETESPVPFLNALGEVLRHGGRDRIRIKLIGSAGEEATKIEDAIRRNKLEEVVTFTGPQPHALCMAEQSNADVLLLFNGPEHVETIRGRSYEYMASGKPILAITPASGAQAEILRPTGSAIIVDNADHGGLKAAIQRLMDDTYQPPQVDWNYVKEFDAPRTTARLASVLDEIALGG